MNQLLFYAPNVHTGGGLVLMQSLLDAWPDDVQLVAWLDARAQGHLRLPRLHRVEWVRASPSSRLRAEFTLWRAGRLARSVLCFHGLPPLMHNAAPVQLFLQNRLYLGAVPLSLFKWRTRLRLAVELAWGHLLRQRVARYWVQTPSMARSLVVWYGAAAPAVHVLPFAAEPSSGAAPGNGVHQWDFVYVADGEAHKNHRRLVQAWVLLAEQGFKPTLALTLSARDSVLAVWVESQVREHGLQIRNLGQMPHADVLALYGLARALVFPSRGESFGLPLIEARDQGLPILAAELDFVRDVCEPVQTFDPESAVSIARAVRRFLGQAEPPLRAASAAEFLQALMGKLA